MPIKPPAHILRALSAIVVTTSRQLRVALHNLWNLENEILESSKNLDGKYTELQDKINSDIKIVTEKERELEKKQKELKKLKDTLEQKESDIDDKIRDLEIRIDEHKSWEEDALLWEEELLKLNGEIKEWEGLHWKFQRNRIPPSAIQ